MPIPPTVTRAERSQDPLVEKLFEEIEQIPFVDSHTHIPLPSSLNGEIKKKSFHYDIPYAIGGATYIAQFVYGSDWSDIKKRLEINEQHAYYRPFVLAMRDLYGLGADDELNDSIQAEISARMDAAHRDPA